MYPFADENEEGRKLWEIQDERPHSGQARMVQTRKFPPKPPRIAATEYLEKARSSRNAPQHPDEENVLGDWNKFLISSQLSSGQDAQETMSYVKAFFLSIGFHTPRNLVGITESNLDKMMKAVERGEQPGYRPRNGFSLRLQTCCHQMVNLATNLLLVDR